MMNGHPFCICNKGYDDCKCVPCDYCGLVQTGHSWQSHSQAWTDVIEFSKSPMAVDMGLPEASSKLIPSVYRQVKGKTMNRITVEAKSVASFARQLAELDHETRAIVTATENGESWASVDISPMTDTLRGAFPTDRNGVRGDTSKRGQSGVMVASDGVTLPVVINRARKLH